MDRKYVVYVHINKINGKRYYGITSMKPEQRWKNGKGYVGNHFVNSINKYGWDGFDHIIIARGLTKEEAAWLEIELIAVYDTTNPSHGYNLSPGGDLISEESKMKMSEARTPEIRKALSERYKGERNPMYGKCGELNPMYGKKHTQETIQKIKENRPDTHGKNNPKAKSVICITTKRIFFTAKEAQEYYGIAKHVASCCSGTRKSCGRLNGQPLKWRYLNYKHNKTYRVA